MICIAMMGLFRTREKLNCGSKLLTKFQKPDALPADLPACLPACLQTFANTMPAPQHEQAPVH
jgi:hypothetical protein